MKGVSSSVIRNGGGAVLLILLVGVAWVAFATYSATPESGAYNAFAASHHIEIMGVLVAIAVVFGFVLSRVLLAQLQQQKQESRSILESVLLFLNQEERAIVNLLVASGGQTTQAEVARLPHMNRVKAHRSLLKMQEKQLIDVVPHGKVRKVQLKESILRMLVSEQ